MKDEEKVQKLVSDLETASGKNVVQAVRPFHPQMTLLQIGWLASDKPEFSVGWNPELIEAARKTFTPDQFSKWVAVIETALKHFLNDVHGGVQ